jgi:hypothetical protein
VWVLELAWELARVLAWEKALARVLERETVLVQVLELVSASARDTVLVQEMA